MTWIVKIEVTLKKGVHDPQGSAVEKALRNLNFKNVGEVRTGKHLRFKLEGTTPQEAEEQVHEMCRRLLTNPVIEDYQFTMLEVEE